MSGQNSYFVCTKFESICLRKRSIGREFETKSADLGVMKKQENDERCLTKSVIIFILPLNLLA
jgi:hypothetical protein